MKLGFQFWKLHDNDKRGNINETEVVELWSWVTNKRITKKLTRINCLQTAMLRGETKTGDICSNCRQPKPAERLKLNMFKMTFYENIAEAHEQTMQKDCKTKKNIMNAYVESKIYNIWILRVKHRVGNAANMHGTFNPENGYFIFIKTK